MKKLIVFAIAILGFTAVSFGQVVSTATASATASGTLVTAVSIVKTAGALNGGNMNFGSIVAGTAGTVVLTTADARSSATLALVAIGTVSAAHFTIGGTIGQTYSVTVPTSVTVSNGGTNMTIDNFTQSSSGTLAAATETFGVGATLNVVGTEAAGLYTTSTPFNVRVDYN